jgi:hypothetical protein
MQPASRYVIGIRFGLITGFLYAILLFCRYHFFSSDPTTYFSFILASYVVILFAFLFTGIARKKELGGFAEVREIFQSIFIAILITEFIYVLFIFIYMKRIDPGFMNHFRESALAFYHQKGLGVSEIDMRMKGVDSLAEQAKPAGLVKGFGTAVVVDSVFGFIFSFILRKQKPSSEESKIKFT